MSQPIINKSSNICCVVPKLGRYHSLTPFRFWEGFLKWPKDKALKKMTPTLVQSSKYWGFVKRLIYLWLSKWKRDHSGPRWCPSPFQGVFPPVLRRSESLQVSTCEILDRRIPGGTWKEKKILYECQFQEGFFTFPHCTCCVEVRWQPRCSNSRW